MDRRSSWAEIPHAVMGTWRIVDGTLTLSLPSEVEIAIQIIKSTPHYAAGMDERRSACELTLLNDHRFVLFAAPDRRKALLLVNAFKSRRHITAVAEHLHPQHPLSVTAEVRAARRVFVIWSQTSIRAQDVLQYALPAYHAGTLVPVLFDRVTPPAPFHGLAAADLTSWNGDFQHPQLRLFLSDIEAVIPDLPERRLEAT